MKNREKYRDEIIKSAKTPEMKADVCEFIKLNVLPHFGKEDCDDINEDWCPILFDLWLDEEYEEPSKPEVDWDNVPVDTLVRVRDFATDDWRLRYFAGFFENNSLKYATWNNGKTSKTANGPNDFMNWRFCELVEDEDGNSSI